MREKRVTQCVNEIRILAQLTLKASNIIPIATIAMKFRWEKIFVRIIIKKIMFVLFRQDNNRGQENAVNRDTNKKENTGSPVTKHNITV